MELFHKFTIKNGLRKELLLCINDITMFFYDYKEVLPGQSATLQDTVSVNCPVQVPPLLSSTSFSLEPILVPVPHVTEQLLNVQFPHLQ